MKITLPIVLGCLLTQAAPANDEPQILVRVQDYAGVSEKLRSEAFAVSGEILVRAGVALGWLDCSPNQAGSVDARCKRRPNGRDIILRLMPEKMAAAAGLKTACLGYAIIPRNNFGTMAAVFVDKARRKAEEALASRSAVLGHAVAHEIAHLLIGKAEHAPRGLMRAVWSRSELLRATASPMSFSGRETQAIAESLRLKLSEPKPTLGPLQIASTR